MMISDFTFQSLCFEVKVPRNRNTSIWNFSFHKKNRWTFLRNRYFLIWPINLFYVEKFRETERFQFFTLSSVKSREMAMFQFLPFHFTQKIRKNLRNRNVSILYAFAAFVVCSLTCLLIITVTLNPDP